MTTIDQTEFDAVEALLPWYASGTLSPEDVGRVERALAQMPELRRRHELVLEERAAALSVNESLGAPSARVTENLAARLDREAAEAPKSRSFAVGRWLAERLSMWPPQTVALVAAAAIAIAIIEAGLLATLSAGPAQKGAAYETASASKKTNREGAFLLISFAPDATTAQILRVLESHRASIVDGPLPGGFFRIKVSDSALTADALGTIVTALRNESAAVRFAAPTK